MGPRGFGKTLKLQGDENTVAGASNQAFPEADTTTDTTAAGTADVINPE
ncbi:MAG TPA: hypothetical protein VE130_10460 [Nitrososphaeraceae archaeon]|nr:hypothetical protein [Nitrososphaeraceae archaeon]